LLEFDDNLRRGNFVVWDRDREEGSGKLDEIGKYVSRGLLVMVDTVQMIGDAKPKTIVHTIR